MQSGEAAAAVDGEILAAGAAEAVAEPVEQVDLLLDEPGQKDSGLGGDCSAGAVSLCTSLSDGVEGWAGVFNAGTVCRLGDAALSKLYCQ